MQEWLEFAWDNKDNLDFKTTQTELFRKKKGSMKWTVKYKGRNMKSINTDALYKAWKEQSKSIKESWKGRCFLKYTEAIPEMHIFFDFMDDVKSDLGYDGFEKLFNQNPVSKPTRKWNRNRFQDSKYDGVEVVSYHGNTTTTFNLKKCILDSKCYCKSDRGKVLSRLRVHNLDKVKSIYLCKACGNYNPIDELEW